MAPNHFAHLVKPRLPAQPQDIFSELVEPFRGIHVPTGTRLALLIVHDEWRIVVLIGREAPEVSFVGQKRLQRLIRSRLNIRVLRPPLLMHKMDHHMTRRRIDDVGGPGSFIIPLAVKHLLAVSFPVPVRVQKLVESDEFPRFDGERRVW